MFRFPPPGLVNSALAKTERCAGGARGGHHLISERRGEKLRVVVTCKACASSVQFSGRRREMTSPFTKNYWRGIRPGGMS